jgi:hypothetical protein
MESCGWQSCFFELHLPTKKVRLRSTPFDDFLSLRWEQRSVSVRIRDLRVTETIDDVVTYHPIACMYAYITVGPTKLNPRRLRSLLNVSDSWELAGICRVVFPRLSLGCPPTNRQQ